MRKFIVISIVLLMLAGFAITSSANGVTLWADQVINVGNLTVVVEGTNLVVTYTIPDDPDLLYPEWELLETHLYVGWTNPAVDLNSAPGQFPYCEEHDPAVFTFTYIISMEEINSYELKGGKKWVVDEDAEPGDVIYIAAQAEIGKIDLATGEPVLDPITDLQIEETAWAEGDPIRPDKNWAMYFEFEIPEPE